MNPQFIPFLLDAKELMLPCFSKRLFGMDCPGCGLQRSVLLLFEGDFLGAFKMYPAIYPLVLLFLFIFVNNFGKFKFGNITIIVLGILSASTILINYFYKLLQ